MVRNFVMEILVKYPKEFYLNRTALTLLADAVPIQLPSFMCFGKYHGYLDKFGFIDEDNQPTPLGKQFLIKCYSTGYFDKNSRN